MNSRGLPSAWTSISNSHYLPNIIKENHTDMHILMEEDVLKHLDPSLSLIKMIRQSTVSWL